MREVGAFEAKTHLSALLDAVAGGEEIVITRHGRPIARLVPTESGTRERRREALARIARLRAELGDTALTADDLLAARDEGRR